LAPKALTPHGIFDLLGKINISTRIARFFSVQQTKRRKKYNKLATKIPNAIKYTKMAIKMPNDRKRYQKCPSKGLPKCTKIGMKIYLPSGNPDLNGFNVSHLRELPMQLKAVHVWIKKNPLRRKKISVALHQCDQICLRLNGPKT
jgi:hypothetical protein